MTDVSHATSTYLLLCFLKHVSILLNPPLSFCQLIAAFAKDLLQHGCHAVQKDVSNEAQSSALRCAAVAGMVPFSHRLSTDMLSTDMKAVVLEHSVGIPRQHTIALLLHIGHWSVGPCLAVLCWECVVHACETGYLH
jgi:hypothetical protein